MEFNFVLKPILTHTHTKAPSTITVQSVQEKLG